MTIRNLAAVLVMTMTAEARSPELSGPSGQKVVVCMEHSGPDSFRTQAASARFAATMIFRTAGVELEWHASGEFCLTVPGSIAIKVLDRTPENATPHALAHAFPFEGGRIEIFYDRLPDLPRNGRSALLAHVMAHEITHILEGTKHHSAEGIMKAHWTHSDEACIQLSHLNFTEEDVQLIQLGLKARFPRSVDQTLMPGMREEN